MADEIKDTTEIVEPEGAPITDTEPEKKQRLYGADEFKQVIAQRDAAKKAARELQEKIDLADQAQKEKNEEFKTLYETAKQKADQLEKEKTEIQTAAMRTQKAAALQIAAKESGMIDPKDASLFVKIDDLELSENGDVIGLEETITKLKETKAHLFAAPAGAPGVHKGTPGGLGALSKEDYLKSPTKAQELYRTNPAKFREIMGT